MTFVYLGCTSSNSVTMPSKLLPISTEHGEMSIQVIGQYERCFQKFRSVDQSLEEEKGRSGYAVLTISRLVKLSSF